MKKNERFYVFYDKDDFVKCFGTAKQLVADGHFINTIAVIQAANKIRKKKTKGYVVTMTMEGVII